ncbi:MAG: AMP-binding protein [Pseudomonadota bacterium]
MSSYVHGASDVPLTGKTIGGALDDARAQWPDALALSCRATGMRLTWAELAERADAFAAGLLATGIAPGERVGLWAMNRAEWIVAQFATAKAGFVLVTINPAYRLAELRHVLDTVDCAALILGPAFKDSDYAAMLAKVAPGMSACEPGYPFAAEWPDLRLVVQFGVDTPLAGALSFSEVEARGTTAGREALDEAAAAVQFDDPVNIQFTSGTTGAPKGVVLSHSNIFNNGYFTGRAMRLGVGDALCLPVPLYHCFGMVTGSLLCLAHGVAIVLPGAGFDPLTTLQALADERCTALYGVPTMYIAMLGHRRFAEFDLTSLRTGVMAGSLCPIDLMRRVMTDMHMREITICYGMTESPVSFQTAVDLPIERRISTVGNIQPHIEAKLIDSEGRVVPRGTIGEICTRGYSAMLGYWNNPTATSATKDVAGWVHTGDLGTIDDQGDLRIVGRLKDMVIRGGENLYPREVEEFLFAHPAVQDVQVFGIPDPVFGEELCAWIITAAGATADEASLRDYCRANISRQKIPKYIRLVDSFPMTVTGKVQKAVLRAMMCEQLGVDPVSGGCLG